MNAPPAARPPGRPPPRRVSRERYIFRRIGVVAVLALGLFGLIKAAGSLMGGDDGAVAEGRGASTSEPVGGVAVSPATSVAATTETTEAPTVASTASPATTVPATGPPSAENPARVLVMGDSDAGTFGPYLETLLDDTGVVDSEVDYKVSSGLSRPDFFDWPAHATAKLEDVDPEIVVVTFGGNDAQGMATLAGEFPTEWADPVGGRDTWFPEYRRRAGEFTDLLTDGERTIIWVGIPNDNNPEVTERLAVQDEAVRAALADRPDVIFVDTWRRFSGRDGNWAEYVIDPRDGRGQGRPRRGRLPPQRERRRDTRPRYCKRDTCRLGGARCGVMSIGGFAALLWRVKPSIARTIVHGSGLRTRSTRKRVLTKRVNPQRVQWFTWPGVLPKSCT